MRNLFTLKKFLFTCVLLIFCNNYGFSQTIVDTQITTAAADSGDDAEERVSDGLMDLASSDLELCYDAGDGQDQLVGIRFQGVNVPQGATVTNCYVQFDVDEVSTGAVTVDVVGIDVDDAAQFTSTDYNISDRIDGDISYSTSATASWTIADWNTIGDNGADQRTPDISTLVKEIIDRPGWSSGNDMAFVFSPNSGSPNFREAEDGDSGSNVLSLHIEYTVPASAEINISGNSNTIPDGNTAISTLDETDFGSISEPSGSVAHTFTIQNFGTSNLTVVNPVISGHTADFSVTANPSNLITGGSSTTFTITFDPTVVGTRSATVTIANNDSSENPYTFNIQGIGVVPVPEINIIGNSNSIPNGNITTSTTDDTDFGSFYVASGSNTNTFTIQNLGTANLTLDGISPYVVITGDTADFTLTANPSTPIAASGSTTFDITFDPTASGVRTATISIANNDSDEDPYTFIVEGTGSIINAGGVWSYLDDGSNQGTAWQTADVSPSGLNWATGNAEFGYGDGDETTVVGYGPDSNNKYVTTYFRRSFTITAADIASLKNTLVLNAIRDDGMVVYINGVEVWRDHITGVVGYTTLADSPAIGSADETTWISSSIANPFATPGTYEIGVEIHQQAVNSSDLSFNFEMYAVNQLLSAGGVWSYLDDGSDQGTAWQTADVSPSGANWATGNAELGFGDGDEVTTIADVDQITTYFRKTVNATPTDATNSTLNISAIRDDGIIIYINGVEVLRNNMPVGTANYLTPAFSNVATTPENFETFWNDFKIPNTLLVGSNEIAVEIHQYEATSGDVSFNLELETSNDFIILPSLKPDRDNDGREDYVDADDDNDGIPDLIEGCNTTIPESLETDGDGETSILSSLPITSGPLNDGNSITYSVNNTSNFGDIYAYDAGEHGYGLRVRGPATDGQLTLDFTNPVKNLFFKLIDFDEAENFKIDVYDEFNNIVDLTNEEGIYHLGTYIEYTGSNTINEKYNATAPNTNNPENRAHDIYGGAYFYFPNINVSKVTFTVNYTGGGTVRLVGVQYCTKDTDGDGIDDFYDSDSDNDGIPDLVEVGGTDTDGDGHVDNFIDVDGDGISAIYDTDDNSYHIEETGTLTNFDFDGDGVNNQVDLDSDNDGIVDLIEAGGVDVNGDGQIDGFTDADNDGYHDAFDGAGSLLITGADTDSDGEPNSYPNKNPDNTGKPNFLDVDSDDDGITDHTEAQATAAAYIGFSGTDTDGDGICDVNDNFVGFAGNGFTPVDSDSDGTPDYIDTDSDNNGELDVTEGHDTNGDGTVDSSDWGTCLNSITSNLGALSSTDTDGDGLDDGFDNELVTYDPSNSGMRPTDHPNIDDIATAERDWREPDTEYNIIDFDGINDYIDFADSHNITGSFSIEAWIKQDASSTGNGMIVSKRDCNKGTNLGYSFGLVNHYPNVKWYDNSGTLILDLTSTYDIGTDRWYSLSITYDTTSTTAKIYIDGIEVASDNAVSAAPSSTNESLLLGAKFDDTDLAQKLSNEFNGWIDEVRIWNTALTPVQIRTMLNQEIQQNGTAVQGKILLTDIAGLNWTDLLGYYPMNTIVSGDLIDESSNTVDGRIRNILTAQPQTAPLPYTTIADGDWTDTSASTPWTQGNSVWSFPNDVGIDGTTPIDWNIVVTNHNVEINDDTTVLGLFINSNELQVNGTTNIATGTGTGNALYVTNYLKIDGVLDLEGESQLLQPNNSIYDLTSTGRLERDQQGTEDYFTYNYWSSPVRFANGSSSFTLPQVFNDGTTPIATPSTLPVSINFITSSYNGSTGSPISIADYWIWKYTNRTSDTYSQWQHVRSTGSLNVGEGFSMKGVANSGSSFTSFQNYVFNGKPNNGDITLALSAGNDYLVGNPYPSAIDADEFILDNVSDGLGRAASNIIDGTIYFWEHFASNTHNLKQYQGGYGMYTLIGSTAAILSDTRIDNTGGLVSTKGAPGQYIPVGQGFFVVADTGGTITFKNSQRIFVTEASASSLFMKTDNTKNKNSVAKENEDTRPKIKLMFDSPKGYHRQVLVGVDENATNGIDIGYDAALIEDNLEDLFWTFSDKEFIIQAVNNFSQNQVLPLGVKISQEGLATIKIDNLENIANEQDIYIHDKELNIYHNLKENNYEVNLTVGEHLNRFEITFKNSEHSLEVEEIDNTALEVYFSNEKESIIINNPTLKNIESVNIYNILGQAIFNFDKQTTDNYIEYKTKHIKPGTYIIKMKTNNENVTKKVLIK